MNADKTTRRSFLAASAVAALAVPSSANAAPAAGKVKHSTWKGVVARFESADRAYNAGIEHEWRCEALYHETRPEPPRGGLVIQSNGRSYTLAEASENARKLHEEYKAADASAAKACGYTDALDEVEELSELYYNAREALFECPAPDIAAALYKAEVIADCDLGMCHLMADLKRLAVGSPTC